MTGPVAVLGPRERRWLVIFLALGSAYFGFLLAERVLGFIGGFATILLILFLADRVERGKSQSLGRFGTSRNSCIYS